MCVGAQKSCLIKTVLLCTHNICFDWEISFYYTLIYGPAMISNTTVFRPHVLFVWFDSLSPINNLSVKQGRVFLGWTSTKLLFCLVFARSLCASVYMCFVVTCWERADLLAIVCGVYCEFVTFPLVSWVRCGTWLYRFLIFAPLLTLLKDHNAVTPVRLGPAAPRSRVKHSTTALPNRPHVMLSYVICIFFINGWKPWQLLSGRTDYAV